MYILVIIVQNTAKAEVGAGVVQGLVKSIEWLQN